MKIQILVFGITALYGAAVSLGRTPEHVMPDLAAALVTLVAVRSPTRLYRATSVSAGLGSSIFTAEPVLLAPLVLLVMGAAVHSIRLALPLRRPFDVAAYGAFGAVLAGLERLAFRLHEGSAGAGAAVVPALAEIAGTAACALLANMVVEARPRLHRAVERR